MAAFERFFFISSLGILSVGSMIHMQPAYAGFEWIPPAQMEHTPKAQPEIPLPMAPDMPTHAAPEVNPTPLSSGGVPSQHSGLAINPYPSQTGYAGSIGDTRMGTGPVEKAMMEESHDLNPAPLGNGLTTAPDSLGNRINMQPTAQVQAHMPAPQIHSTPAGQVTRPVIGRKISRYDDGSASPPMAMPTPLSSAPMPQDSFTPASTAAPFPASSGGPVSAPSLEAAMFSFDEIQGFGQDMPLAVALTQIVPSDYALSFETDVNPGTPVSWEGGRSWDQVLDSMLDPLGLQADISGKVVRVRG